MRKWGTIIAAMGIMLHGGEQYFEIRQVAAEVVYLELVKPGLLNKGDTLHVRHGESHAATLEVISVSSKFVSCKILRSDRPVEAGDMAVFLGRTLSQKVDGSAKNETPQASRKKVFARSPERKRQARKRRKLRGTVSLQYHHFDATAEGRDYAQPTLRLNIRAAQLRGGSLGFRLRTRTRYNVNEAVDSVREATWNNRIYEASVKIGHEDDRFQYQLGRLISNKFSGAGYIDGALGRMRVGKHGSVGVFAGQQPRWQQADDAPKLNKFGAYYGYERTGRDSFFSSTVAAAGEYVEGEVNREYVFFANRFSKGGKFSLYQSAELDINRDWRAEVAEDSVALTNLYVQGRYRFHERLSWSLGYDNRRRYFTYDVRNQDERFFEELTRQGWRTSIAAKLGKNLRLNAGAGLRTQSESDDTNTWYASLYHPNLIADLSLRAQFNGFTNPYTQGQRQSLQVGKRWRSGHNLYLGVADYTYTYLQTGEERANRYLRLEGYISIGRHFFLNGQYEHNTGDDAEGNRIYLEFGIRL